MPSSSVAVAASLLFLQVETLPAPTSTCPPLSVTVKSGRTLVRGAAGWVSVLQVVSRSAAAKPSAGRIAVRRLGIGGDLGPRGSRGAALSRVATAQPVHRRPDTQLLVSATVRGASWRRVLRCFYESEEAHAAGAPQGVRSGARGESRTLTGLPPGDFESPASAIPPLGRGVPGLT